MLAQDAQGLAGVVVYIGDSRVRRWVVQHVEPNRPAVNWGIGGAYFPTLTRQVGDLNYRLPGGCRAIVLMSGINDARWTEPIEVIRQQLLQLFKRIAVAGGPPLVVVGPTQSTRWAETPHTPEEGAARLDAISAELQYRCSRAPQCTFVSPPPFDPSSLEDGVHLTPAGYAALEPLVAAALAAVP